MTKRKVKIVIVGAKFSRYAENTFYWKFRLGSKKRGIDVKSSRCKSWRDARDNCIQAFGRYMDNNLEPQFDSIGE